MTKGEAIKIVQDWLEKEASPNESEATTALMNPPIDAIKRLLREARAR